MNEDPDFKDRFVHPDPENAEMQKDPKNPSGPRIKKKVDFCTYWGVSAYPVASMKTKLLLTRPLTILGIVGLSSHTKNTQSCSCAPGCGYRAAQADPTSVVCRSISVH